MNFKPWNNALMKFEDPRGYYLSSDGYLFRKTWDNFEKCNFIIPVYSTGKKDKNGVELFGGDRAKDASGKINEIKYNKELATWTWGNFCIFGNFDALVKIGNKFENPEMVEKK